MEERRGLPCFLTSNEEEDGREKIVSDITQLIGWTPLIELKRIVEKDGVDVRLVGKIESYQPLSSVKDRGALRMIEDAEEKGLITPGITTLLEPTSGNLGISLAYIALRKGYKFIAVMQAHFPLEKMILIRHLGAEVLITDPALGFQGQLERVQQMKLGNPNIHVLDQFANPANPEAHFISTGPEIWKDTAGKVDILVCGSGSGGTLSGAGKYLKMKNPVLKVICVEPAESPVISGGNPGRHNIQGMGPGFVPKNLDMSYIDEVITVTTEEAMVHARRLAREEGLLVGISSGANLAACLKIARRVESKGKMVVTVLPSGGERYLSTELFDELVGWTPLVELKSLAEREGVNVRLVAKMESYQPLSSIKDRSALRMIEDAEEKGLITPGITTLVELTSGNFGIGLAYIAAKKGYKFIGVMPAHFSLDKRMLLRYLGADVSITDPKLGFQGGIERVEQLKNKDPDMYVLNQLTNPANLEAHFTSTGPEIWKDTAGKVDIFVCGSGTAGTVCGAGKYLKMKNPDVKVICVEPAESAVISGGQPGPHDIQGLGPGIIPENLDMSCIDEVIAVTTEEAMIYARRIAKEEGFLVGISSGANLAACLKVAERVENRGKMIVTIFASGGERYMSTQLFDESANRGNRISKSWARFVPPFLGMSRIDELITVTKRRAIGHARGIVEKACLKG